MKNRSFRRSKIDRSRSLGGVVISNVHQIRSLQKARCGLEKTVLRIGCKKDRCHPRESGDPVTFAPLDSRLRGNDDIYARSFCNRFLKDQTDADEVPAVVGSVLLDAELSSVRIVPV